MTNTYVLWPERPEIKHNLIRHINALDPSKVWDIEVKEYRKPKSVSQRGWFHESGQFTEIEGRRAPIW